MDDFEKALKNYGNRSPPKSIKKPSRSGARSVYLDPETLMEVDKSRNTIRFDSVLEATCYRFISQYFTIETQKKLTFYDCLSWKPDFYLPEINAYVEVKGQWILQYDSKESKKLFIWQYLTAVNNGYSIYLASDSQFSIGNLEVLDYVSVTQQLVGLKNND